MSRSPKVRFQQVVILVSKSAVSPSRTRTKQIVHGVLIGPAPASGSGTVTAGIAGMTANGVSGTSGDAWTTTSATITETVVVSNNPPTASNVQISPSSPTSSDDITLTLHIFGSRQWRY